jgi:HK97 family phage major capsid protein
MGWRSLIEETTAMSIAARIAAYQQSADTIARAVEFVRIAQALLASKNGVEAQQFLRKVAATERAQQMFVERGAVPAAVTYDSTWAGPLVQFQAAADAFAETLRNLSAFDTVLGDGAFMRVPPQTTVRITTAGATAYVANEGAPKPASVMAFVNANVTMSKVPVFVVVSAELMKAGGPGPMALLGRELRGALAQGTDQYFLGQVTSGLSAIPSSGSNSVAIRNDLRDLLDAVVIGAASKLYFVMPPQISKRLAVVGDSVGGRMFPGMTPTGGTLDGIPALVSDVATAGQITLLDAAQFAVSAGQIELDRSDEALLQLDSAPDSPPLASSPTISLWGQNLSALRAERYLGAQRLRTTAAASVSGFTGVGSSPS